MTERSESKLSVLASTCISSAVYAIVLNPLDVIKNTQIGSLNRLSVKHSIEQIISHKGLPNLWRGISPSLVSILGVNLVHYSLYEILRPPLDDWFGSLGSGLSAMVAKLTAVIVSSPIERFKTSLMGTGSGQLSFSNIGFSGLRVTLVRDVLFSGTFFLTMENLHKKHKDKHPNISRTLSCTTGAILATLITHPFDVIKTKLQTRNCCYSHLEKIPFSGIKLIVKREGLQTLTHGIWPRLGRLVLGVNIYINLYEYFKQYFDKHNFYMID
ncbi:unnamed protein product [Blepharisma stoltei]|uniref:Mitochondrial carrier protein n=1 Tax=Blepharisma stoltei TaxID=1481888 RepID=A0AAU9JRB2_9CILI|nr:unnamed protein product [Blepharisma stoltei]